MVPSRSGSCRSPCYTLVLSCYDAGYRSLVFLLTLLLYLRTLVPDIYVSDFVEFQYQPALLGLPHPNGFPFYMVLGWLGSHVPVGSVAWRMNVLSAVGGALAVAVTTAFAQRLSRRASVGLLAGGLLALSPTFWYYSLAAERYTLNIALLAGVFWTAWEATRRLKPSRSQIGVTPPGWSTSQGFCLVWAWRHIPVTRWFCPFGSAICSGGYRSCAAALVFG